ncbi:hypothetical protein FALBO_15921 [Fusarium albosuccineum]|uniref:Secreted protein n=1 Tax=Fusarium albosuccineum TaxID=1237068 RepID=A0A8H4PAM6_9HYPO|nr:hypothetical protein FALBO_15921 [Fusarium albosuccineum]
MGKQRQGSALLRARSWGHCIFFALFFSVAVAFKASEAEASGTLAPCTSSGAGMWNAFRGTRGFQAHTRSLTLWQTPPHQRKDPRQHHHSPGALGSMMLCMYRVRRNQCARYLLIHAASLVASSSSHGSGAPCMC